MSDETDLADEIINITLQAQIEQARRPHETASATGFCLFCGEPIAEPNRRWCDADCRNDWELENRDIV